MSCPHKDRCYNGRDIRYGYFRIGLTKVLTNRRVNFCDIHFRGALGDEFKGTYTAGQVPFDSTAGRRQYEIEEYQRWGVVHSNRQLEKGGRAILHADQANRKADFWLMGPVRLGTESYGSIVVRIDGLRIPKVVLNQGRIVRQAGVKNAYSHGFSEDFGRRKGTCTLWGSKHVDLSAMYMSHIRPVYTSSLPSQLRPISMPPDVKRIEWKVESISTTLTFAQVYDQRG